MGSVAGIFIAATPGEKLVKVESVQALPGRGIQGDRYFDKPKSKTTGDREITLIESEAVEALHREYQVELAADETRRNILTRGVALNHLVGREFEVGQVKLRGLRLCEPCGHLEKLTRPGVRAGLVHRGGLRAQILTAGDIRIGDTIRT